MNNVTIPTSSLAVLLASWSFSLALSGNPMVELGVRARERALRYGAEVAEGIHSKMRQQGMLRSISNVGV